MNALEAHLIELICALSSPADSLIDDEHETPDDAAIAEHIRSHFIDGFSRDDAQLLLSIADRAAPITFRARNDANFTPYNSTLLQLTPAITAVTDYCLN